MPTASVRLDFHRYERRLTARCAGDAFVPGGDAQAGGKTKVYDQGELLVGFSGLIRAQPLIRRGIKSRDLGEQIVRFIRQLLQGETGYVWPEGLRNRFTA